MGYISSNFQIPKQQLEQMLENRSPKNIPTNPHKRPKSNRKVDFSLPKVSNSRRQKYDQGASDRLAENISLLPKIKIDSMPHITQENQEFVTLDFNKAKRSQRILGEKNTFLRDVQSKLKKVLDKNFFQCNLPECDNDGNTQENFQKKIDRNLNLIKNAQMKKVVSIAERNVRGVVDRHSERKRKLSIEEESDLIGKENRFQRANLQKSENKICHSNGKHEKSLNAVKSAKNIQIVKKDVIHKSKSSDKIEILSKVHSTDTSSRKPTNPPQSKNIQLFKNIHNYLDNPTQNPQKKQRDQRVLQSVEKCKQDLEKQLLQVEQKLRKRICIRDSDPTPNIGGKQQTVNSPDWMNIDFNLNSRKQMWSTTNFQKEIEKITIIQKKNSEYLGEYLIQKKDLMKLQNHKQRNLNRDQEKPKQ